jgi:hypothetical protein
LGKSYLTKKSVLIFSTILYDTSPILRSIQEKQLRTGLRISIKSAWRDLPGHRYGKLVIGRPCKKRADDLLRLSRPQLKTVSAILTGQAPVRRHLNIMGLFDGDPSC